MKHNAEQVQLFHLECMVESCPLPQWTLSLALNGNHAKIKSVCKCSKARFLLMFTFFSFCYCQYRTFFLNFCSDKSPFCGALCFRLWLTLPMGFKLGWMHHCLHSMLLAHNGSLESTLIAQARVRTTNLSHVKRISYPFGHGTSHLHFVNNA